VTRRDWHFGHEISPGHEIGDRLDDHQRELVDGHLRDGRSRTGDPGRSRTDEITPNIVKSVRRDEGIRGPEGSTPEANARIVKLTSWEIKYSIPISPKLLQ
jgi:hypothetical protein